jgi:hypothetical protein
MCTQKIVITLLEKAVPRETVNINPIQEQYDPAYLKVNPKGVGRAYETAFILPAFRHRD